MSKGKRKQQVHVHVNKYASQSKAANVMAKLDAEERSPKPIASSAFTHTSYGVHGGRSAVVRTITIAEQQRYEQAEREGLKEPEKRYCPLFHRDVTLLETRSCILYLPQNKCDTSREHCIF